MKISQKFAYRGLSRVTNSDGSRFYTCPVSGTSVASVTTILDATSEKPELEAWKLRVGERKATQIKDEATGLGSLMHEHLECHLQDLPRPKGSNLCRQMAARMADCVIARGLGDVDEIWGIETGVYYPQLYAGTTDLIGVYKGRPAIMDFKTTKKLKTAAQIEDYFCQLCAYSIAHDEVYATTIQTGVIFMVSRDLQFERFVIDGDQFEDYKVRWLTRLEQFLLSAPSPPAAH